MHLVTAEEMRRIDRLAIHRFKIPALTLMENAGAGACRKLLDRFPDIQGKRIAVIAGKGNNGGDGLVLARHLLRQSADVQVFFAQPEGHLSGDALAVLKSYREAGGRTAPFQAHFLQDFDILVDALFGTGLSKEVTGESREIIESINNSRGLGKWVLSLDIPSGLSADKGKPLGMAVKAHLTVTMGLPKLGFSSPESAEYTGDLEVIDIGIPKEALREIRVKTHWVTEGDIRPLFSPRRKDSHKGDYGHLLLVGGSAKKPGAILLSGLAALRTGAGLVTIALPDKAFRKFPKGFLELMYEPLPSTRDGTLSRRAVKKLLGLLQEKEALAVGPGMGVSADTRRVVDQLYWKSALPRVLDADALNCLGDLGIEGSKKSRRRSPAVLTPHPGEMARLLGGSIASVQARRVESARDFAKRYDLYLVLKGFRTLVATPEGVVFVNSTGNPGMATAGMGDVLTGVIGSLLAQGMRAKEATLAGVYLHGRAGDRVAARIGDQGLLASDVIEEIPSTIKEIIG